MTETRREDHGFARWFNCPGCCGRVYESEDEGSDESRLAEHRAWPSEVRRGAAS
jgi:hypothetical protein